jgi:putative transposase
VGHLATRRTFEGVRCDNGLEFTSRHFLSWCEERKIQLLHIQPGRPMQNGRLESVNGKFRDECLNANWFSTLMEAQQKVERWRSECNLERPHSSLGYLTPAEFGEQAPSPSGSFLPLVVWRSRLCDQLATLGLDRPPRRRNPTETTAKGQTEVLC